MSDLTCNGVPVVSARITRPRIGSWVAELVVDTDEPMTGAVVLADGDGSELFKGTIIRGAPSEGRLSLRVLGGAGGLGKTLDPRYYKGAPPRLVLRDLARETGETLATLDAPALDAPTRAWTRERRDAAGSLRQLAEALGLVWRCLPDGTQWVGSETWPASPATGYEVLHDEPAHARWTLSTVTLTDAALIAPGTTLEGQRVSLVEHQLSGDSTRTVVSFEKLGAELDRLRDTIAKTIQRETAKLGYSAMYPARVVLQDSAGALELVPDDPRLPPMTGVPVRLSIPGSVRVPAGSRVLVGFEDASPAKPYASLFEGTKLDELKLGEGTRRMAREGDSVSFELQVNKVGGNIQQLFVRAKPTDAWVEVTNNPASSTAVVTEISSGSDKVRGE